MRFNTGNPIGPDGSSDPRDLYDTAGIADLLVNGPLGEYLSRLGVPLKSWRGIMQQVTDYLIAQSYESTYLVYGPGVVVQRQTQLVQRDGELYRVMNAADIPLTLTGTWATDAPKLQAVGDAALRAALLSTDGAGMVVTDDGSTVQDWIDNLVVPVSNTSTPVFIEQHVTGFFGRGMLEAEIQFDVGEQNFSGSATVGAVTIPVANTATYKVGGTVTVRYPSGKYLPHFVKTVAADSLGIVPGLYEAVTTADALARTWFDSAHPGRFYTRYLAQRVSRATEIATATATTGRRYFSQYDSNPTAGSDLLTAIGGASVAYFDETNEGNGGLISNPVNRIVGRAAFVSIPVAGGGFSTPQFAITENSNLHFRGLLSTNSAVSTITIELVDSSGKRSLVGRMTPSLDNTVPRYRDFLFKVRSNGGAYHIEATSDTVGDRVVVDQIEIFGSVGAIGRVLPEGRKVKIVALGDSWVAGFLEGNIQREPLTQQLAIELPQATIINAGVGGNAVQHLLARFDTDVAPHNPDFVVVNTGTNDAANPASVTFYPNAVDFFKKTYNELISRIQSIGARPIIIGVPALAEARGASINWEQNNRARMYSRYFYKDFAENNATDDSLVTVVERSGDDTNGYIKYSDGVLRFWSSVNVNMTNATTSQTFSPPAGANPIGRVRTGGTLITPGSANSWASWASHAIQWASGWVVRITTAGASASDLVILSGEGRWK